MRLETHRKSCKECKGKVSLLLRAKFGELEKNKNLNIPAGLSSYIDSPYYVTLEKIYEALQGYRGYNTLVRRKNTKEVDFFAPMPGFILEFDERQHFTIPRKIALSLYPDEVKVGFDKALWMKLCEELHQVDNDPKVPFRDEQRAWYDTLRDFAPYVLPEKNLLPTKRILDSDRRIHSVFDGSCFEWCSLDQSNPDDINKFAQLIK